MSLWFVGFQGSTPIGGPIVGLVIAAAGARAGLALGGLACIAAALIGARALRKGAPKRTPSATRPLEPAHTEALSAAA